jgi:DNA-binding MarR family transcriptional regulator
MEQELSGQDAWNAAREAEINRRYEEMMRQPILEVTEPDASVAFAFQVIQTARAFEYHLTRAARSRAMTALQARFAWVLATSPWPIPMPTLEAVLGLSHGGVSRMVARMRDRGLVETELNPGDPRGLVVGLTEAGKREWALVREDIAAISAELRETVGQRKSLHFRASLTRVEALDERYLRFEGLRNPSRLPT